MRRKRMDELTADVRFWMKELEKDEHSAVYWDLRWGRNGLELRLQAMTFYRGQPFDFTGQWFTVGSTVSREFWESLLYQLVDCHRAISSFKLLGDDMDAQDLAFTVEDEDDIPF